MSDKATALETLETEYQNLRQAIDGLDNAQLTRAWLDGWGVRDIIAHILAWERVSATALERMARGEKPTPEGVDYSNSDEWNAKFAAELSQISPQTVVAIWQQAHMNFVRAARALPDDRYAPKEDGKPSTASRVLEGNGFGHFREHAAQVREWRQREGL